MAIRRLDVCMQMFTNDGESGAVTAAFQDWTAGMRGVALCRVHIPGRDKHGQWRRKAEARPLMDAIRSRYRRASVVAAPLIARFKLSTRERWQSHALRGPLLITATHGRNFGPGRSDGSHIHVHWRQRWDDGQRSSFSTIGSSWRSTNETHACVRHDE